MLLAVFGLIFLTPSIDKYQSYSTKLRLLNQYNNTFYANVRFISSQYCAVVVRE